MNKIVKLSKEKQKKFLTKEQFIKELDRLEDKINNPLNSVLNLSWEQIEEIENEINNINDIIYKWQD